MSGPPAVCIDANLVVRNVGPERMPSVVEAWHGWARDGTRLHAPALLRYEVINAVHRMRSAGQMGAEAAGQILTRAFRLPIVMHNDDALHLRAFQFAAAYGLPAAYDAHYLALAERLGVDFWTADVKLFKAVSDRLPWVRLVG